MLKVYFGNDVIKIRAAAIKATEEAVGRGATLVTIDDGSYQTGIYADATHGASLFGGAQVYLIDTPSNDEMMATDHLAQKREGYTAHQNSVDNWI